MRRTALIIIWTLSWLILESTWLSDFPAHFIRLDMVFISVLAVGFLEEMEANIVQVFLMGFISDCFSSAPFGILTAVYLAAYWVVHFATSTIYLNSILARFVWTSIASVGAILLKAVLIALIFKNPQFLTIALLRVLPQSIWNGLLGIAVIPFFIWYTGLTWEKIFKEKGLVLK